MRKLALLLLALPLAACATPEQRAQPFDKYVGYYQNPEWLNEVFTIRRVGDMFFAELPTQPDVSIFPDSQTKFYATVVDAQLSFDTDPQGNATGLVLRQNGIEVPFKKIDDALGKKIVRNDEFINPHLRKCWDMSPQPRPGQLLCAMAGQSN